MPSLSHRSSLLFRRHSATSLVTDSDIETEEISSPSKLDPFQSKPTYPLPTVRERPSRPERPSTPTRKAKGLSRKQTLLESKSTPTPKIVLASPSTSTIHYLFPADNSSSHLTAIPFDSRLPRYTGTSSSSVSGSDVSRQRLSRRSLETYDYAPIIESGSSRRLSKPVVRVAPKHSPRDSLDYTKGLKTRLDPDGSGRTNGLKDLGRGYPASTRVTPTTITVLGPTKRVPSLGTEPAPKRESIGTRLKLATTTPVAHAPATTSVSLRTISPISNPAAPGIIKKAQSMRTLRRQRSLADLERKVKKVDMARMPALMERENHVEIPVSSTLFCFWSSLTLADFCPSSRCQETIPVPLLRSSTSPVSNRHGTYHPSSVVACTWISSTPSSGSRRPIDGHHTKFTIFLSPGLLDCRIFRPVPQEQHNSVIQQVSSSPLSCIPPRPRRYLHQSRCPITIQNSGSRLR